MSKTSLSSQTLVITVARPKSRILRHIFRKELERNESTKVGVVGLVDHCHPSAARLGNDAVMRNCRADHGAKVASAM